MTDILPKLHKALKLAGDTHTVQDVAEAVKAGSMQAFFSDRAFVVTEVAVAPRKKWLNVFLAAGDLEDVMALQPQLEAFGKEQGCSFMVMTGRKGWARVLPDHGWMEHGVSYARPLENANG